MHDAIMDPMSADALWVITWVSAPAPPGPARPGPAWPGTILARISSSQG